MITTGYGAELSGHWADHLAERKPDAYTVVSTFAGCGGSSLGYSMAGFRELLAVEWDDHAAAMFRLNFPDVPVHHGDIGAVDPTDLGLPAGALDVLDGSPPCQGFSTSGKRDFGDDRNDLFREFVRLLAAWQPRMFVMENVSGLVKGKMRVKFVEILRALKAAGPGYDVRVRLLDASWYRVPQARQRLVFVGARADLATRPEHPTPTRSQLTVREAWHDLRDPGAVAPFGAKQAALVPFIGPGENGKHPLQRSQRRAAFFDMYRERWDRPSYTLTKGGTLIHPALHRRLGVNELTRIQSFPDEYDWARSSPGRIAERLGNSVPPLLMRAVASTVRDTLDRIDGRH